MKWKVSKNEQMKEEGGKKVILKNEGKKNILKRIKFSQIKNFFRPTEDLERVMDLKIKMFKLEF